MDIRQTHRQTDIATTRPTRPRGAELVKTARRSWINARLVGCIS